jgi:hypothetical protein
MLKALQLLEALPVPRTSSGLRSGAAALPDVCSAWVQQGSDRKQSSRYASSSAPVPVDSVPAQGGKGFGFRTRFRDMTDGEFKTLLARTREQGPIEKMTDGPKKMKAQAPAHHTGIHATQWSRLEERVTQSYTSNDINRTDVFAVIEAGPSQFKGMLSGTPAVQRNV